MWHVKWANALYHIGLDKTEHINSRGSLIVMKKSIFLQWRLASSSSSFLIQNDVGLHPEIVETTFLFPKFWTIPGRLRFFYLCFFFRSQTFPEMKISSFKKSFFLVTRNIKVVSFRFRVYPKISENILFLKKRFFWDILVFASFSNISNMIWA